MLTPKSCQTGALLPVQTRLATFSKPPLPPFTVPRALGFGAAKVGFAGGKAGNAMGKAGNGVGKAGNDAGKGGGSPAKPIRKR